MIIHTCNPRLHASQLTYIINHADDRALLFDPSFAPLVEGIAAQCPRVKHWICLTDDEHMPEMSAPQRVLCYEQLIAAQRADFPGRSSMSARPRRFATPPARRATLKARSIQIAPSCSTHCRRACPDLICLSPRETILPAVPMFHVNGWCVPYAAPIGGAKLVLPGHRLDAPNLYETLESEKVTVTAGVPTIWIALMRHIEQGGLPLTQLEAHFGGRIGDAAVADRQV